MSANPREETGGGGLQVGNALWVPGSPQSPRTAIFSREAESQRTRKKEESEKESIASTQLNHGIVN